MEVFMSNEKLETQVTKLETKVDRVTRSNSELRDELTELKNNYSKLVEGVNNRFQLFEKTFRKS